MNEKTVPGTAKTQAEFVRNAIASYGRQLHRFLLHLLRNPEDARDVWQDTFAELCQTRDTDLIREPRAFIYRIAWRVFGKRRLRARRDLVAYDSEAVERALTHSQEPTHSDVADEVAVESDIESAFCRLPETHQSVLLLSLSGKSDAEIADELALSVHTITKYLKQAKAHIRRSCSAGQDPQGRQP